MLAQFQRRKATKNKKETLDKVRHHALAIKSVAQLERDRVRSLGISNLSKQMCALRQARVKRVTKQFARNAKTTRVMLKFFDVCFQIGKGRIYKTWDQWQALPERIQGFMDDCNVFKAKVRLFYHRRIKKATFDPLKGYHQLGHTKMKLSCTRLFNTTMEGQVKQAVSAARPHPRPHSSLHYTRSLHSIHSPPRLPALTRCPPPPPSS